MEWIIENMVVILFFQILINIYLKVFVPNWSSFCYFATICSVTQPKTRQKIQNSPFHICPE